jgi:hypothetical protein
LQRSEIVEQDETTGRDNGEDGGAEQTSALHSDRYAGSAESVPKVKADSLRRRPQPRDPIRSSAGLLHPNPTSTPPRAAPHPARE